MRTELLPFILWNQLLKLNQYHWCWEQWLAMLRYSLDAGLKGCSLASAPSSSWQSRQWNASRCFGSQEKPQVWRSWIFRECDTDLRQWTLVHSRKWPRLRLGLVLLHTWEDHHYERIREHLPRKERSLSGIVHPPPSHPSRASWSFFPGVKNNVLALIAEPNPTANKSLQALKPCHPRRKTGGGGGGLTLV